MSSAIVRTCERLGLGLGILAILGSLATGQTWQVTLGVGLGAALALVNLVAIRVLVSKALGGGQPAAGKAAMWALLFAFKLSVLVGFVWVAIQLWGASTSGFLVGVTAVLTSVILASILMSLRNPDALTVDRGPAEGAGSGRA